jgi:hypothetical protein
MRTSVFTSILLKSPGIPSPSLTGSQLLTIPMILMSKDQPIHPFPSQVLTMLMNTLQYFISMILRIIFIGCGEHTLSTPPKIFSSTVMTYKEPFVESSIIPA